MDTSFISLSEAARRLGVMPKRLSQMIWLGQIDTSRSIRIGMARAFPVDQLPEIRKALIAARKRRGKGRAKAKAASA